MIDNNGTLDGLKDSTSHPRVNCLFCDICLLLDFGFDLGHPNANTFFFRTCRSLKNIQVKFHLGSVDHMVSDLRLGFCVFD